MTNKTQETNQQVFLTADEALDTIKKLSTAQGFYGRLYDQLLSNQEIMSAFEAYIEKSKFSSVVYFIIDLES